MAKASLLLPLMAGLALAGQAQPMNFARPGGATTAPGPAFVSSSAKSRSTLSIPAASAPLPQRPLPSGVSPSGPARATQAPPASTVARGASTPAGAPHRVTTLGPTGYPNYPGPGGSLPVPDSYHDNPHIYVDVANPTNPYNYYLNVPGVRVELAPIVIPTIRY